MRRDAYEPRRPPRPRFVHVCILLARPGLISEDDDPGSLVALTISRTGIFANRSRASSSVRTGDLPCFTTCSGPRTARAGLIGLGQLLDAGRDGIVLDLLQLKAAVAASCEESTGIAAGAGPGVRNPDVVDEAKEGKYRSEARAPNRAITAGTMTAADGSIWAASLHLALALNAPKMIASEGSRPRRPQGTPGSRARLTRDPDSQRSDPSTFRPWNRTSLMGPVSDFVPMGKIHFL